MIRHSEGTAGPQGYNMLFGGKVIDVTTLHDHPGIFFSYKNKAGKVIQDERCRCLQITNPTWVALKTPLELKDFSPHSKDLAALALISDAGAMSFVITGHFMPAIDKLRKIWASLPGSGWNQPEHTLADVEKWYEDAGGKVIS